MIGKATATVTLNNLNPVYDGTGKSVSVTTTPPGLTVNLTYNGTPMRRPTRAVTRSSARSMIQLRRERDQHAGDWQGHCDRDVEQSEPGL